MKFKAGDILIHNNGEMKVQVLRIFKDAYDLRIISGFSKKVIKCIGNERLIDGWMVEESYTKA